MNDMQRENVFHPHMWFITNKNTKKICAHIRHTKVRKYDRYEINQNYCNQENRNLKNLATEQNGRHAIKITKNYRK